MTGHLLALLLGTALDRLVGDPDTLWRRLPHPVVLAGRLIGVLDRRWNRETLSFAARRRRGVAAILILLALAAGAGLALAFLAQAMGPAGTLLEAIVVAVLLAGRSLADHVRRVAGALEGEGIAGGRRAVAMIVGRDPELLDEAGVSRAAIESLAENASDGLVAPWLFFLVLGLPGLLAYKMLNTADSMIGHMNERHRAFGWAAARLDDVANWPAARLTALLLAMLAPLVGGKAADAWRIARRDAGLHRSPNAGWPESAAAGALGLALGGPRRYRELVVEAPLLHPEGRREAGVPDIRRALRLLGRLMDVLLLLALVLVLVSLAA